MLLAIEGRLRRDAKDAGYDAKGLRFTLLSADADILITYPPRMRRRFNEILSARGITVITGRAATGVESGVVDLAGGEKLAFDEVFWATEASPAPWLAETGVKLDPQGFIEVEATLQSTSHANVFAAGDIASLRGFSLPKAGVYAVRQGPTLASNLRRAVCRRAAANPQAARPHPFADLDRRTLCSRHAQRSDVRRPLGVAMEGLARPALYGQVQEFASWRYGAVTRV